MTFKPFPELIRELIQDFKPTAPPPPSAYARTHRVVAGLHTKRWHILFQYLAMQTILVDCCILSVLPSHPTRPPAHPGPPRPATPQAAPAHPPPRAAAAPSVVCAPTSNPPRASVSTARCCPRLLSWEVLLHVAQMLHHFEASGSPGGARFKSHKKTGRRC